ncbi:MAG TPA: HNH endonuclease signature motif containing protein [Candidatus Limnocylindrales bacterium]|nr:HNH endonuclease signature motif containing protein [Candidatus Limnocylindrales bacterium]
MTTTRFGRQLWRVMIDLASRMHGQDVPAWRVAEAVAGEATSWPYCDPPGPQPPPPPRPGQRREAFVKAFEALHGTCEGFGWVRPPQRPAVVFELDRLLVGLADADAFEIDARLRIAREAMQRIDAQLATTLRRIADGRLHQRMGFADLRLYAEARLGMCGSKAMALVRLDRECAYKSPLLLQAYRDGRVGWLAATALLRVIGRNHEQAWIERARKVTLRRLSADISWALDRADDDRGDAFQPPPPLDLDVTADALGRIDEANVQMRAHTQADMESFSRRVGSRIGILMPASVASLLEDAIEGCRRAIEPRWRSFERILAHAYLTWTSLPQHEDPLFARDSYRCQVPGCSRRGMLHRHHVWFRSLGGPDFSWNLTCVCEEHHGDFIHRGFIRVDGCAPDGLIWELGCRAGKPPLMRLRGDVYLWKARASEAGNAQMEAAR